ncbi:TIGR00266 family protein [Pseudonocardiaceae bacterium YIM PH 21723]|nr:TIGR00266 family protein [Pseudonocardiaceae bacterium YIM PH 21723]
MQVQTRHCPGAGVARVQLKSGESIIAAMGTMVASSYGVTAQPGGKSRKRTQIFSSPEGGGWLDLAPQLPGDIHVSMLDGTVGWCIARGSCLAYVETVSIETQWGGFRSLFGGEGGFLTHATGSGPLVLSSYGALDVITLAAGELVTVDTGHLVAYSDGVQSRIRALNPGMPESLKTGEGLVFDFAGPGRVLVQSRNPRALVDWLRLNGS